MLKKINNAIACSKAAVVRRTKVIFSLSEIGTFIFFPAYLCVIFLIVILFMFAVEIEFWIWFFHTWKPLLGRTL